MAAGVKFSFRSAAGAFYFLIIFGLGIFPPAGLHAQSQAGIEGPNPNYIVQEINAIRAGYGIPALRPDAISGKAAEIYARELADRQVLSHRGLDGSRVVERYRNAGGTGLSAGEILGAGDSLDSILTAWMDSPSHRESILNPEWFSAGAGLVQLDNGRLLVVVVFNNSRFKLTSFTIDNGKVILEGLFFLNPEFFPQTLFLRIGDTDVTPQYASKTDGNNIILHFEFSLPDRWAEDGIGLMQMNIMENDYLYSSDLILRHIL